MGWHNLEILREEADGTPPSLPRKKKGGEDKKMKLLEESYSKI